MLIPTNTRRPPRYEKADLKSFFESGASTSATSEKLDLVVIRAEIMMLVLYNCNCDVCVYVCVVSRKIFQCPWFLTRLSREVVEGGGQLCLHFRHLKN